MVKVKLYHAENLRFNDNNFTEDFVKGGQRIDFYSVGVHHQSAVVELKIKEVWYGGGQFYYTQIENVLQS